MGLPRSGWSGTQVSIGQPMVHQGPIHSVRFSPDSRTVVTGSADGMARLWDSATGKPIGPRLVHEAPVKAVDFSPAGDVIQTLNKDGVFRWERAPDPTGPDERFILWTQVLTGAELGARTSSRACSRRSGSNGGPAPPSHWRPARAGKRRRNRRPIDPALTGQKPRIRERNHHAARPFRVGDALELRGLLAGLCLGTGTIGTGCSPAKPNATPPTSS